MAKLPNYFFTTAVLGSLSGMRSLSGLALVAYMLSRKPSKRLQDSHLPIKYIQTRAASHVLAGMAFSELLGDKLPTAPNRIVAPLLAGRFAMGGLTGATLFKTKGNSVFSGALLAGACAVAAAYTSFYLRKAATGPGKLSNFTAGFIEDLLVYSVGAATIWKIKHQKG